MWTTRCAAHIMKNRWNRLQAIDGWDWYTSRMWWLLSELPEGGGRELLDMEHRVQGAPGLRRLVGELCEKWLFLLCPRRVRGMPQTNNCTEQAIGRSKVRYKAVRGYKSVDGMMNGLRLTQWVWSGEEGLDLAELMAAYQGAWRRELRSSEDFTNSPTAYGTITSITLGGQTQCNMICFVNV